MAVALGVVVGQWLLTFLLGWGLLGFVDTRWRSRLDPAAPAIGLAASVIGLYAITLAVGIEIGGPILALASVALGLERVRRHDAGDLVSTATISAALAAAGLLGFAMAALPSVEARTVTVMATSGHDSVFYVSGAEWLIDHRVGDTPSIGTTPADSVDGPANASANETAVRQIRIGDMLLSAAAGSLSGQRVHEFWLLQVASWLLYLPGSVLVAVAGFGRPRRHYRDHRNDRVHRNDRDHHNDVALAAIAGLVVSTSSLLIFQVHNQNAASVLGIVFAPMALGAVFSWLDDDAADTDDDRRLPLGISALALAALLGSYSEYTPILGIGFVAVIVARRPSEILPSLGRGIVVGFATLAIGPLIAWRLVQALVFTAGVESVGFPSLYRNVGDELAMARVLGVLWPTGVDPSTIALLAVGAVVVVGAIAAAVLHRGRALWLGLAVGTGLTLWLVTVVIGNDYSHQRTIEITQPLFLLSVVFGLDALLHRLHDRSRSRDRSRLRIGSSGATAGLGLAAMAMVAAAVASAGRALPPEVFLDERAVDDSYDDLSDWATEHGGTDGADLSVVLNGYPETLWAVNELQDFPDVSYPVLYPDYATRTAFADTTPNRFVIVDRTVVVVDRPGEPMIANDRFALYDTSTGPFTALLPRRFGFYRSEADQGRQWAWLGGPGQLIVVRDDDAPTSIALQLTSLPQLAPMDVTITGSSARTLSLGAEPTLTIIPTPERVTVIEFVPSKAGKPPVGGGDARSLAMLLETIPTPAP